MSETFSPQPNEIQFSEIQQITYAKDGVEGAGADHVYGVDEAGKKHHIGHLDVMSTHGYGQEDVNEYQALKSEQDNNENPESPVVEAVEYVGGTNPDKVADLKEAIEDKTDRIKDHAKWQSRVDTTEDKPSKVGLTPEDIAYNMWLESNATGETESKSLREARSDDQATLEKERMKDMARLGMRVKTGVATADEIGYYYTLKDAADAEKQAKFEAGKKLAPLEVNFEDSFAAERGEEPTSDEQRKKDELGIDGYRRRGKDGKVRIEIGEVPSARTEDYDPEEPEGPRPVEVVKQPVENTVEVPITDPSRKGIKNRIRRIFDRAGVAVQNVNEYFNDEEKGKRRRVTGYVIGAVAVATGAYMVYKGISDDGLGPKTMGEVSPFDKFTDEQRDAFQRMVDYGEQVRVANPGISVEDQARLVNEAMEWAVNNPPSTR